MSKLLTISIPTYNRAGMLLNQLNWLAAELVNLTDQCDIVVHDNASTDNTQQVVEHWKSSLKLPIHFTYIRNNANIGGMANIVACLKHATGKFIWTLGDDDPIANGTVEDILSNIKAYENLGLILLNGRGRDVITGNIKIKQWFHKAINHPSRIDANSFNYFLTNNLGGILFISSTVYRNDLVKEALIAWPDCHKNLAAQAFWVAYCAARGSFIITSKIYTECAMGIGFTDKDPQWTFKMRFLEIPEVFLRLMNQGYNKTFCLFRVLHNIKSKKSVLVMQGSFRRWPMFSLKSALRYSKIIAKASLIYIFDRNSVTSGSAATEQVPELENIKAEIVADNSGASESLNN